VLRCSPSTRPSRSACAPRTCADASEQTRRPGGQVAVGPAVAELRTQQSTR
jgi:hypothetical protein